MAHDHFASLGLTFRLLMILIIALNSVPSTSSAKRLTAHHVVTGLHLTASHDLVFARFHILADQRSIGEQTVGTITFLQRKIFQVLFLFDRFRNELFTDA